MNGLLLGAVAVGLLAVGWWWFRERSARGVQRRAQRTSRKAAGAVGVVGIGFAGIVAGVSEGLASGLGGVGDILAQFPGFLAQLVLGGLGYLSVTGTVEMTPGTYLAIALATIGIAIMVKY